MKVVLTGNTGFIGSEVLSQCISNPAVSSIVALSRKKLTASSPKLKTIIHEDFTSYPPSLMSELQGADTCIWSLGLANPKTPEQAQKINMDYTLAAAKAFADLDENKRFRFVYLSGQLTEKDQDKNLWILGDSRKLRGRVELELLKLGKEKTGSGFEVFIARPGFVVAKQSRAQDFLFRTIAKTIRVDWLATALIKLGIQGNDHEVSEMEELVRTGKSINAKS